MWEVGGRRKIHTVFRWVNPKESPFGRPRHESFKIKTPLWKWEGTA